MDNGKAGHFWDTDGDERLAPQDRVAYPLHQYYVTLRLRLKTKLTW